MKPNSFTFSQSNILYGSGDSQKQLCMDEYCDARVVRLKHVFGELKGIGIDTVHEIRRRASLLVGAGVQVFTIWRFDEMTHEASQAFLKLLEEPPEGAVFFLCSRTLSLPATIISRTSRFAFFGEEKLADGDSEAAQLFTGEIIRWKTELEKTIFEKKTVSRVIFHKLEMLVGLSTALVTTRISPKYLIDSFNILA